MDFLLRYLLDEKFIKCGIGAIILLLFYPSVISLFTKGRSSFLILQEFNFYENKDVFLEIKGRRSGFWNWVLSLFNKAPIISLTCSKRLLKYDILFYNFLTFEASKIKYYIPMIKISCVSSSMLNKFRIIKFILGIFLFIMGITEIVFKSSDSEIAIRITLGIIGIILLLCSFIKKRTINLGIYSFENKPFVTLTLKKGIINSIEKETFEAAVNTFNKVVLANAIEK